MSKGAGEDEPRPQGGDVRESPPQGQSPPGEDPASTRPRAAPDPGAPRAPISWKVKLIGRGLVLLVTLVILEVVGCVGGRVLRARGTFYEPLGAEGFAAYAEARDPEVGWPREGPRPDRDESGSRISPAFPDTTARPCISIYGDSFAYGDEVDHDHAWGNLLAARLKCRVANHGIVGYGTDQALIRLRRKKEDRGKVMLLGFPNENIHRNVNRYRGLIVPKSNFTYKPRFILDKDGKLEPVPMLLPQTPEEHEKITKDPARYIEHDYFVPGGPGGVSTLSFPYTLSIASLLGNFRIQAAIRKEPSHAAFFRPDHPSRAMHVTAAIAKAFSDEAAARGGWGAFLFIPLIGDMEYRRKKGTVVHQPLTEELQRQGVPVLDPTDRFLAALDGKNPCVLFTKCSAGHYNEEGYRLLAEVVHDLLKEQGKL